jgi:hypothetical protein
LRAWRKDTTKRLNPSVLHFNLQEKRKVFKSKNQRFSKSTRRKIPLKITENIFWGESWVKFGELYSGYIHKTLLSEINMPTPPAFVGSVGIFVCG